MSLAVVRPKPPPLVGIAADVATACFYPLSNRVGIAASLLNARLGELQGFRPGDGRPRRLQAAQ